MTKTVQYLIQSGGERRLVVITEDHYLSLLDRSGERQRLTIQDVGHQLPDQVISRIKAGENPLAVVRRWRGLNGKQLARMLGISPSMVSQMERHWRFGSTRTMIRLADVLDIPLELFLHNETNDEEPAPAPTVGKHEAISDLVEAGYT